MLFSSASLGRIWAAGLLLLLLLLWRHKRISKASQAAKVSGLLLLAANPYACERSTSPGQLNVMILSEHHKKSSSSSEIPPLSGPT